MKILHILNDKPMSAVLKLIEEQKKENEIEVIELDQPDISYENIIDQIVNSDKVVSWNNSTDGKKH